MRVIFCECKCDRVGILYRVTVRYSYSVAVGIGHALHFVDNLNNAVVVVDRVVVLQLISDDCQ